MTNVVPFTGNTRLDADPDMVLEAALLANLEAAIVIGWQDGKLYFASSIADGPEANWMLDMAKHQLMKAGSE